MSNKYTAGSKRECAIESDQKGFRVSQPIDIDIEGGEGFELLPGMVPIGLAALLS